MVCDLGYAVPVHRRPRGGRIIVRQFVVADAGRVGPARPRQFQRMTHAGRLRHLHAEDEILQRISRQEVSDILRHNRLLGFEIEDRHVMGEGAIARGGPSLQFLGGDISLDRLVVGQRRQPKFADESRRKRQVVIERMVLPKDMVAVDAAAPGFAAVEGTGAVQLAAGASHHIDGFAEGLARFIAAAPHHQRRVIAQANRVVAHGFFEDVVGLNAVTVPSRGPFLQNHDAVTVSQVVERIRLRHAAAPGAQQLHMRIFRQLQEAIVAFRLEAQQGIKRAPIRPLDENRFPIDHEGPVVILWIGTLGRRLHLNRANPEGNACMIRRAALGQEGQLQAIQVGLAIIDGPPEPGLGHGEFEQLGLRALCRLHIAGEVMRLAFKVLGFDAADQLTAPFFSRALEREMQAQQAGLGVQRGGEGVHDLDRGRRLQVHRPPDAERGQVDVMPAIDIVDDSAIEPADIHAGEEVVGFALADALRRRIEPNNQRVVAVVQQRCYIVSNLSEHAFMLAQLMPIQPDGAGIADTAEYQSFAAALSRAAETLLQPPGFEALGSGDFVIAAYVWIGNPSRLKQGGLNAARHDGGNGIGPIAAEPIAFFAALDHHPAVIQRETRRSRRVFNAASAQFYCPRRARDGRWSRREGLAVDLVKALGFSHGDLQQRTRITASMDRRRPASHRRRS